MANHKKICDAYLYNIWGTTMQEHRGEVWVREDGVRGNRTYFKILNDDGVVVKILNCTDTEGLVFHKTVWFCEPDKHKAAEFLIKYEMKEIAMHEFRIKNHKKVIEGLKQF